MEVPDYAALAAAGPSHHHHHPLHALDAAFSLPVAEHAQQQQPQQQQPQQQQQQQQQHPFGPPDLLPPQQHAPPHSSYSHHQQQHVPFGAVADAGPSAFSSPLPHSAWPAPPPPPQQQQQQLAFHAPHSRSVSVSSRAPSPSAGDLAAAFALSGSPSGLSAAGRGDAAPGPGWTSRVPQSQQGSRRVSRLAPAAGAQAEQPQPQPQQPQPQPQQQFLDYGSSSLDSLAAKPLSRSSSRRSRQGSGKDREQPAAPAAAPKMPRAVTPEDEANAAADAATAAGKEAQRRQNSSCDACRQRKVACKKVPGEAKCVHCKAKGIECTTIYIQLATTGTKQRPGKRPRTGGEDSAASQAPEDRGPSLVRYLLLRDAEYSINVTGLSYETGSASPPPSRRNVPSTAAETRLANTQARADFCSDLIETYFSIVHIRYPIIDPDLFRKRWHDRSPELGGPPPDVLVAVILAWGAKYSESPIIAADRAETATELTPRQKQKREAVQSNKSTSTLLTAPVTSTSATEPQWLTAPRDVVNPASAREAASVVGRSRIAEDLIVKAQEVLERQKAHRIATMDNAKACLIVQALFWQRGLDDPRGAMHQGLSGSEGTVRPRKRGVYMCNGVWMVSGLRHLIELQVHLQETVSRIDDMRVRGEAVMTWWLACMMDAHMAAMFRRKPHLDLEDYSVELPFPPPEAPGEGPGPLSNAQSHRIWLDSAREQVELMRSVYPALWTPNAAAVGVSSRRLDELVTLACRWRNNHLALVGAPSPTWPSNWNFASAVTAAASDMNYHLVWIFMFQAIEEFGIAELNAAKAQSSYSRSALRHGGSDIELDLGKIRAMQARIYDEALNAALRCASLSQVLTNNGYLRLEAGIMKVTMSEAGYCLAHFRRPEILSIIDGLRQYGQAFEECYDQADALQALAAEYMEGLDLAEPSSGPAMGQDVGSSVGQSHQRTQPPPPQRGAQFSSAPLPGVAAAQAYNGSSMGEAPSYYGVTTYTPTGAVAHPAYGAAAAGGMAGGHLAQQAQPQQPLHHSRAQHYAPYDAAPYGAPQQQHQHEQQQSQHQATSAQAYHPSAQNGTHPQTFY